MYQRLSAVLLPIVTLALIGTGVWGYQEHQDKNSILIKAENQYQRAFHDLSYYMGQLEQELGKTTAVNATSQDYQKRRLIQVWQTTSQAQNQINQLPLNLLPFTKTEEFLDKIANFSYQTSIRDLTKKPLTKKENETLSTLYTRSKQLSKELGSIQNEVMNQSLRWMDVEVALASATEKNSKRNGIIDGFKIMDDGVGNYEEVEWGSSVQSLYKKRSIQALSGPNMDENSIRQQASAFVQDVSPEQWIVTENGKKTNYNTYSVSLEKNDGNVLSMDYSKHGGKLLWYMNPRDIHKEQLSLEQAKEYADQFLQNNNYHSLTPVNYDHYGKVMSITYAAKENGIVYYPKKITLRVAMDDGEVVGMQAQDYVYETPKKKLEKPKLSLKEASKLLNPSFRQLTSNLSYVGNELRQDVLCYEFTGTIHDAHYRIFLNADTGAEEKIESIEQLEATFGQERG
jgi:spore germination protein